MAKKATVKKIYKDKLKSVIASIIYFRKAGQINFKHLVKQSRFPGEFDLTQVSKIIQKNGQGFQKLGKLRVEAQ
jgi:hypothetical protein